MLLVAFRSFLECDKFTEILNVQYKERVLINSIFPVDEYTLLDDSSSSFYTLVVHSPEGTQFDYIRHICTLREYVGRICLFNATAADFTDDLVHLSIPLDSIGYIYSVETLCQEMHCILSTYQSYRLNGLLFNRQLTRPRRQVSNDNHLLERAVEESIRTPQPPVSRKRSSWFEKLKDKGDVAQDGDPVCVICTTMRASVCFVPCFCQVACDECVKTMWESTPNGTKCPTCRTPIEDAGRPNQAEKKRKGEEEEEGEEEKSQ